MRIIYLVFFLLTFILEGHAQVTELIDSAYFRSPIDFPLRLSGSFAELRKNHFHSGIDIKSKNRASGDTLRAVADGFVSRLKIQYGGYGKAIYMDHSNGYTSVYAHLRDFHPKIAAFILKEQKKRQTYPLDISTSEDSIFFKKGDYIGIMGNTGRSYGPHLHFEIRHTQSEKPINPLLFNIGPTDKKAPFVNNIYAYSLSPDFQIIDKTDITSSKNLSIPAWRIGIAFNGYDKMDGANNLNGIAKIRLWLNHELHYEMLADSFSFDETRSINACMDYAAKKKYNRNIIQVFKLPGNPNSMIKKAKKGGLISLYKNKAQLVRLELEDYHGNLYSKEWHISRDIDIPGQTPKSYQFKLAHDKDHLIENDLFSFRIDSGGLYKTTFFNYQISRLLPFPVIQLHQLDEAMHGYASLAILNKEKIDSSLQGKLCIFHLDSKYSYGNQGDHEVLFASIDRFGEYTIKLDTISPSVKPLASLASMKRRGNLTFILEDNFKVRGKARDLEYDCYINGEWVLGEYSSHTRKLSISLDQINLRQNNTLRIRVTDDRDNVLDYKQNF